MKIYDRCYLMTDVAMTGILDDMGKGSGCTPGSMVLLTRLAKQVYRRSNEELLGMHLRHLVALSYVRDHDGCPQQELADAFCMDANNVVLLLNELEELGYVTRLRDPHDRRRHLVQLTGRGARRSSAPSARRKRSRTRCCRRSTPRSARRCWRCSPARCAAPSRLERGAAYSATTASIST